MNNKQTQFDFKLLDSIIDENPDLNEQEILNLYQKSHNPTDSNTIEIIPENISDCTELLLNSAISSDKPEDPYSQAKYVIREKISTGGQSDVYLTSRSDGTFSKTVIMKVLKHKFISEDDRNQFLNEIQILAGLNHPNIVKILDAGFNKNNEPWMVLEYIQGQHLDTYIKENKLSLNASIKLIIDIAESLLHIHSNNIYHLDIKPANILVKAKNNESHPYLIDFGVSSIQSNNNNTTVNLATPAYASPEQLQDIDSPIDHHSDIYSIGKLIVSLLTGWVDNNKDLKSITNKCTQTNPKNRYTDMQALLLDLRKFLAREPVSTRSLTLAQKGMRRFQQKPLLNGALILLLISVIILIYYSVTQKHKQKVLLKQQSQSSQHYWKVADEITNSTRILYLRPSTNIQKDLNELKSKYLELEQQYLLESTQQRSAIALSLAKAAVSLGFYNKAQTMLLFVHKASPLNQDININLASNYINLYQIKVQDASLFSDSNVRKAQIAQARKQYLEPAQNIIKHQNIPDNNSQNKLFKSMLLYFNGDISTALKQLKHIEAKELWPIPRMLFASAIMTEEARKFYVSGKRQEANVWYKKAYQINQEAHDIARSHPQIIQQKCTLKAQILSTEISKKDSIITKNIQDCEESIALLKGNKASTISAINAYYNLARTHFSQGQDPQYYLDIVVLLIQNSSNLNYDLPQKNFILGQLNQIQGQWQMNSNQSSVVALKQSVQFHKNASELRPHHYMYQLEYANALYLYASSIKPFNSNANNAFSHATQIMHNLLSHADATILLSSNLVETLTNHSYFLYQNGIPADKPLVQAVNIVKQMEQTWPNNLKVHQAKSNLDWTFADYLVYQNKSPEPYLSQAIQSYDFIINKKPNNWITRYNQVSALLSGITYFVENQINQTAQLQLVDKKLTELNNIISNNIDISSLYGYYFNMLAHNKNLEKRDIYAAILESRKHNSKCIDSEIDGFSCLTQFATLVKIEHEYDNNHDRFDISKWNKDLLILSNGLKKYPEHHQLIAHVALLKVYSIQLLQLNKALAYKELKSAKIEIENVFNSQPLLKPRYLNDITHINKLLNISK